jgi:hypothetical protein
MSSQSVTGLVGFSARIATHTFVALLMHPLSLLLHHPTHSSHMSMYVLYRNICVTYTVQYACTCTYKLTNVCAYALLHN